MKKLLLTLLLGSSLLTVGCAQENVASTTNEPVTIDQPIITTDDTSLIGAPDGSGISGGYGGTASLSVTTTVLESFLGKPVNSPSNIQVHVDLEENSDETFSGDVSIYVTDRGVTRSYSFSTGSKNNSSYNRFIKNDSGFHAILDDGNAGMIVLVIDDIVDLGDGLGNQDSVNGRIFFKNYPIVTDDYGRQMESHPLQNGGYKYCWEITVGPYQCKPWTSLASSIANPWPTQDVSFLGKFTGLSITKALNLD